VGTTTSLEVEAIWAADAGESRDGACSIFVFWANMGTTVTKRVAKCMILFTL
jgi:hypothetical protein